MISSTGSGADVSLTDSVVWHNFAQELGGGIYRDGRQGLIIARCLISRNRTPGVGGGLTGGGRNFTRVIDSAITSNLAAYGGGIGSNNVIAIIRR